MGFQVANSLGVYFCKTSPMAPTIKNNLAGQYFSKPLNGWKGNGIKSVQSGFGFNIIKSNVINSNMDTPEMSFMGVSPGNYDFSVWAKLKSVGQNESSLFAAIRFPGQSVTSGRIIASGIAKSYCWTKLTGGFTLTGDAQVNLTLTVGGLNPGSTLYLAAVYVSGQNQEQYYKNQNAIISSIRKRDVHLNVVDSSGSPFVGYAEIEQLENDFPFGGSISSGFLQSETYRKYFKKRFSWAVYENEAKWYATESNFGAYTYDKADAMMSLLEDMNISIRGHNVLWDDPHYVQQWIQALTSDQVVTAVSQRVQDVVSRYKGKFMHWDVVNEFTHFNFYENATGDPNFVSVVHKMVAAADPNVLKFVNDYNIIESYATDPNSPERYLKAIANVEANGGVVDRIGVEGHFGAVDGPRVRAELDMLATGGIPVWITELDVLSADPVLQADQFELAIREAFSHPVVEGILLWAPVRPNCLVPGPSTTIYDTCQTTLADANIIDKPVGERYLKLRKEWSTRRSGFLKEGGMQFRAFFGKFKIRIYDKNMVLVAEQGFNVPNGQSQLNLTLQL